MFIIHSFSLSALRPSLPCLIAHFYPCREVCLESKSSTIGTSAKRLQTRNLPARNGWLPPLPPRLSPIIRKAIRALCRASDMRSRPPAKLPELFLSFLAPSIRSSPPQLPTSQQPLASADKVATRSQTQCRCGSTLSGTAGGEQESQKRGMSRLATRRTQEDYEAAIYIPVASTSGECFLRVFRAEGKC